MAATKRNAVFASAVASSSLNDEELVILCLNLVTIKLNSIDFNFVLENACLQKNASGTYLSNILYNSP